MNESSLAEYRKYVWDYFQLHATQRLTTFNFYLVISTFLIAGLFTTLQPNSKNPTMSILLGLMLSFFSYVFWKLDARNMQLISVAEEALKYIEDQYDFAASDNGPHVLKIFACEEFNTMLFKKKIPFWSFKSYYSYAKSLRLVFFCFGIVGITSGAFC